MSEMWNKGIQEITQSEHISPEKTGDNIEAKKSANYVFNKNTLEWERYSNIDPSTAAKQDDQITLATALNTLTNTLQKTVLSSDKTFLMLQGIRDAIAMPVDYDEPTNAKRILASGGTIGTVTTVTTVSTLSNQTNIGGSSADMMVENTSYQDWGLSIRSNLI